MNMNSILTVGCSTSNDKSRVRRENNPMMCNQTLMPEGAVDITPGLMMKMMIILKKMKSL